MSRGLGDVYKRQELELLQRLWPLVNDRLNYFTPTKKPTGYSTDRAGRRKRVYDAPKTPYQRLLDSGILSVEQKAELQQYRARLDLVGLAEKIDQIQQRLVKLAASKTAKLEREIERAQALPDPAGIKVHHTRAG